ncbi:hypothetical protein AB0B45_47295 [Nonomuraea sp. NPDC049152]|uniref:hypothetical protein n=1 Tax=Nonomuraea sp. NPDC049152 TaxID=3154350 RepID=UPI0033F6C084
MDAHHAGDNAADPLIHRQLQNGPEGVDRAVEVTHGDSGERLIGARTRFIAVRPLLGRSLAVCRQCLARDAFSFLLVTG